MSFLPDMVLPMSFELVFYSYSHRLTLELCRSAKEDLEAASTTAGTPVDDKVLSMYGKAIGTDTLLRM